MRIGFGEFSKWDFHACSVETMPLGGSQSAACYLTQALARQGHDVFLLNSTSTPGSYGNVTCLSLPKTSQKELRDLGLDAFVCLPGAGFGKRLREVLGDKTKLVLWTQHRINQPAVEALADVNESGSYDAFAFVSEWQREEFRLGFGLPGARTHVLRNGAAPAFVELFPEDQSILPQKSMPPVLAYTSTPFRGLDLLIEAFPSIRAQVPEVRLRVFSSMSVYQVAAAEEQAEFGALYERCRQTAGVEYVGSMAQPALAREMRSAAMLAYPNTFPETSCIAALEAMASGCRVVTSGLGALPETTAGLAQLIPPRQERGAYLQQFVERTVASLSEMQTNPAATEETLRQQVHYIRENATWDVRAREWGSWLERLGGGAV
ncbi:glycosyl transferase group 1 [Chthoniobacter flavus Ellin428]|uniref:Glycosyl transferase group 1 n=1 Tax=Chthoniobacter flavus Ellin428 TaxID=497964 RepID=B4D5P9_9BACT|nr:glycosyltransferase family 4 protein [Chthoniobacter flavus]EDY18102.1 glycosyl transferase group 1 [Chthoniobacter flavus Ellin428]TCO93612.1 glycosyl transferase family 1 [Chthoniobacter flavus]